MKKIILFGIATFMVMGLYSNPNPPPEIHINEFMFTSTNSWTIEIMIYYGNLFTFDSITFQTSTGVARVINFHMNYCIYFTKQDLSQPLTINPIGDSIGITAYSTMFGHPHCGFAFGNFQNPVVVAPSPGQSIARFYSTNCIYPYEELFSLSNHPTLGLTNDTTGTSGTIQGTIYDLAGQPVTDQIFYMDHPFTTDAAGHLSTRIYSRIFSWDTLCYEKWPGHISTVQVFPISYTMVPDSAITRDIHLLTALLVGTPPQPEKSGSTINVFPNPVTDVIMLSYTTDLSANKDDLHIDIYDMNGKKMLTKDLENRLGIVRIPVDLSNEMYIAILSGEGKIIGSARFIIKTAE